MALTPAEQAELEILEREFGSGSTTVAIPKVAKPKVTQPQPQQRPTLTPKEQQELQGLEREFGSDKPVPAIAPPSQSSNPLAALYAEHGIAALSALEESKNNPIATSSNRKSRTRNAGTFQFHQDNMPMILDWAKETYPEIATNLVGFKPGSKQFEQQWAKVVAKNPEQFKQFERNAAMKFFYEPAADAYTTLFGMKPEQLTEAERLAIFSTSIQHGGYRKVFANMLKYVGKSGGTTSDRLDALYRARSEYAPDFKTRYARERDLVRAYELPVPSGEMIAQTEPLKRLYGAPPSKAQDPRKLFEEINKQELHALGDPLAAMGINVKDYGNLAEILATSGFEYGGRAIGSAVAPALGPFAPLGPIAGGAIGSMTGKVISDKAQGKPFSVGETLMEGALSVLPDAVDPVVALKRRVLSKTPWGTAFAKDKAAEWLLTKGKDAFLPISKSYMDASYQLLKKAGVQMDMDTITKGVQGMSRRQFNALEAALPSITDDLAGEFPKAGERAQLLAILMRSGKPVPGVDLSWLTHIRSQAKLSPKVRRSADAQEALDRFADLIDETIINKSYTATSALPDVQAEYARHYARYRESIDFAEWLRREDIVTRSSGHSMWNLDLGKMVDRLRVPGGGDKLGQQVQQSLLRPGNEKALLQLEEFVEKLSGKGIELKEAVTTGKTVFERKRKVYYINIEGAAFPDTTTLFQFLSKMLSGPSSRERFMRLVAHKRGKLSTEDVLVLAANFARRSNEGNEYLMSIAREKEEEVKNSPTYRSIEKTLKGLLNQGAPL